MPDLGRVHRFRDHAVAGVNWRPTRFVDDVPSQLVCDLCRMIPKRMLALPCAHTLCQSCHAANYSGGCCPLDQEPFEETKLFVLDFPTTKFNALKVHCWNEAHGCQYEGAVEDMLRHYENECAFHTVECMRCGEEVLHRELSTHYVAGCSTPASPALTENISSESRALTVRDVTAALEELKALLRDANHEQLLLGIQGRLNELTDHIRSRDSRSAVIQHDVAAPASSEAAQVAVPSHSTSSQRETSRDNHRVEASTSSPSSCSETVRTSRKMGYFTNLPVAVLKDMRKLSSEDYPQYAVTDRGPWNLYCHVELLSKQSRHRPTWRGMHGGARYELAIENIHERMLSQGGSRIISKVTILHTTNAYSRVEVSHDAHFVYVLVDFNGMLEGSQCLAPTLSVEADLKDNPGSLPSFQEPCSCNHDEEEFLHFHRTFRISHDSLKRNDCLLSGALHFYIHVFFPKQNDWLRLQRL
nr:uncharacterized protein LOC119184589 [Rhipicephalus microplus]